MNPPDTHVLMEDLQEARRRTLALLDDLTDAQLMGPRLDTVNPLLWEMGHLAWFQERWALRELHGQTPLLEKGDDLYDSSLVPHHERWDRPLPARSATLAYMHRTLDNVLEHLGRGNRRIPDDREAYFHLLALYHEDMHAEALVMTRQTLGYPAPTCGLHASTQEIPHGSGKEIERLDAHHEGGLFSMGSPRDRARLFDSRPSGSERFPDPLVLRSTANGAFVWDNQKWAHERFVGPFAMAETPVTQGQYLAFVQDGGYQQRVFWPAAGWDWRCRTAAEHPVYWRKTAGHVWLRRRFQSWQPLDEQQPVIHVNWFEAMAFCRWAGRRLPTEAEWAWAAAAPGSVSTEPGPQTAVHGVYPWGAASPTRERANLDGAASGVVSVHALPAGDSRHGCRQLMGNVWEWTSSDFLPYPGFSADPYTDYSRPWFSTHKVLRGGCWLTRSRLINNLFRNFYAPDRRDAMAGFRTCAILPA